MLKSERVAALIANILTQPVLMQLHGILARSIESATVAGIVIFLAVAWIINLQTIRRAAC